MPEPRAGGCSSAGLGLIGGRGGDGGSEALGMSAELPAAAGDPQVVAGLFVIEDGEHGVLRAVVVSAQALAVVGVGRAVRPRDAVVLVGLSGRPSAAGEHAGAVP